MTRLLPGTIASGISGHLWAPEGAYDALATITVPSGGLSSIIFSSIPTGYKHLQIRGIARDTGASYGYNINLRFNSVSSNYTRHNVQGNGDTASASGSSSTESSIPIAMATGGANLTNNYSAFVIDVLDYNNTTKNTTVKCLVGYDDNYTSSTYKGYIDLRSGAYLSTNAINSISLLATGTAFAENSLFSLYGVK